jgi:hypothetical protein
LSSSPELVVDGILCRLNTLESGSFMTDNYSFGRWLPNFFEGVP